MLNESYAQTVQDAIIRMNHEFAGGVNRPVYHIRPYIDTPASSWPGLGFSTAKVTFSNAWNRTEPYWVDEAATNDYFARTHEVLTQGAAKRTSRSTSATTPRRRRSARPIRTTSTGRTSACSAPATRGTTSTSR